MNKSWQVLTLGLFLGGACNRSTPAPEQTPAAQPAAETAAAAAHAGLTRVADPSQVCMVNNQFMGRDQIPVEYEGRTYYGCCAGCVTRIQTDPAIRRAIDPVTHHAVDKAAAVMAQDAEGNILYFENEQSFAQYSSQAS